MPEVNIDTMKSILTDHIVSCNKGCSESMPAPSLDAHNLLTYKWIVQKDPLYAHMMFQLYLEELIHPLECSALIAFSVSCRIFTDEHISSYVIASGLFDPYRKYLSAGNDWAKQLKGLYCYYRNLAHSHATNRLESFVATMNEGLDPI